MKLQDWLRESKISATDFARSLGCTRANVSGYLNGKHRPSLRIACEIEKLTDGKVKASDLLQSGEVSK